MYQTLYGIQNINSRNNNNLSSGHRSYQNTIDFLSPDHNKDIAIAKQKQKIKYLKEKINCAHQINQVVNDKEDLYAQNKLLQQKIVMLENNMILLTNENNKLKSILHDKSNMMSTFEDVIAESKTKLTQLTQTNDILREQVNNANQKIITFRQSQSQREKEANHTNRNSTQYTDSNLRVVRFDKKNNNKEEEFKESRNANLNAQSNAFDPYYNSQVNKNHGLHEEINKLRLHIKRLEKNFKDNIGEKDKAIEQLWREKEILITEIEQVSKDREQITERLYTQNETEYNEILSLKTLLNNMSAKKDFNEDIYLSNLQRLNVILRDKNKEIDKIKQKNIPNKSSSSSQNKQVQFFTPIKTENNLSSPNKKTYTMNIQTGDSNEL